MTVVLTLGSLGERRLAAGKIKGAVVGEGHLSIRVLGVGQGEFLCNDSVVQLGNTADTFNSCFAVPFHFWLLSSREHRSKNKHTEVESSELTQPLRDQH